MNKELIYKVEKVLSEFEIVLGATETIEGVKESWGSTKKGLMELGIEVKAEKEAPKNHYEVYGKLADSEKEKYLDFNGMAIRYDKVYVDENGLGDTILTLYRNGIDGEIATIILKGNKDYEVITSEQGTSFELIEK